MGIEKRREMSCTCPCILSAYLKRKSDTKKAEDDELFSHNRKVRIIAKLFQ